MFILDEFIKAAMVMFLQNKINKRSALRKNKYNDLLVAILNLRFDVWGWVISDQGREDLQHPVLMQDLLILQLILVAKDLH